MTCRVTCRRPSPSMAHCGVCHRTFGGVTGFDLHRHHEATRVQTGNRCADPAVLGMQEHNGVWRQPMDMDVRERLRPTT